MSHRLVLATVVLVAALPLHAQATSSRVDESSMPLRLDPLGADRQQITSKALGDPVDVPPRTFSINPFGRTGTAWVGAGTPAGLRAPALGWTVDPLIHDTSIRLTQQLQQVRMTNGRTAWDEMQRVAPVPNARGSYDPGQPPAATPTAP
jgi:hypothetical protein